MTRITDTIYAYPIRRSNAWHKCSGALPLRMTNDFLFRAILQTDNKTLVALIAALLAKEERQILSATITNPIMLGDSIENKYFVLDVRVLMNDDTMLNLEMQVCDEHNWSDRSLGYLCRLFDNLNRGDAYEDTKAAIQFSFLDFTVFEEHPEFFASYKLLHTREGYPYTDKFQLHIIDLTNIHLATGRDKAYRLDLWARMFKARTWEDLKMLAKESKAIDEAVSVVYQLSEDDIIREQCRQRDEFYLRQEMERLRLQRAHDKLKETEEKLGATEEKLGATEEKLGAAEEKLGAAEEEIKKLKKKLRELSAS